MSDRNYDYDYADLWKVINKPEKFELMCYLTLAVQYPDIKWYKTPKTRDNKHDGETIGSNQKIYFESKYVYNHSGKKLSHKEVGSNINVAIYDLADLLWIFTNARLQNDLVNYIERHNEFQELVLKKPLRICAVDRQKSAMLFLRNSFTDYLKQLKDIELTGYKSKTPKQLLIVKENIITEGKRLLEDINDFKKDRNDYFWHPTLSKLKSSNYLDDFKTNLIKELFKADVYYDTLSSIDSFKKIKVPIGATIFLVFRVTNYFFEDIDFKITLKPNGIIKFISPLKRDENNYFFESQISALGDKIYSIEFRVERTPFNGIEVQLCLDSYKFLFSPDNIEVYNLLFFAPFIGESNNKKLSSIKEKLDRTFYEKKVIVELITGRAGAGKTRFISEIIDHSYRYNSKIFRVELVAKEGKDSFIREFLIQIIGLNSISFISLGEQFIQRLKNDGDFSDLFINEEEFLSFEKTFNQVFTSDFDKIPYSQIDKIAQFTYRILYKISLKYLLILVFEDLHHGNKRIFRFLSQLYDTLKLNRARIVMLLAARTEIKEHNKDFEVFRAKIINDSTYSVNQTEILPLSDKDSLQLVKELVKTETKFDKLIKEKIVSKTGNNPFNIIHTLLFLKNSGIIKYTHDYEWHQINRLNEITIHIEIEKLLKDRFTFYFSIKSSGPLLKQFISILCLFDGKIRINLLLSIFRENSLYRTIDFFTQERIIKKVKDFIVFDHENIFQFTQRFLLKDAIQEGVRIYKWLKNNFFENEYLDVLVRCLYYSFPKFKKEFFEKSYLLFNNLIKNENWNDIIRYGQMIIEKAYVDKALKPLQIYEIKFAVCQAESECIDILQVIDHYWDLEKEMESYFNSEKLFDISDYGVYYLLQKVKLYKCDVIIMSSNYTLAQHLLKIQFEEIKNHINLNKNIKESYEIAEIIIWLKNRLAITYKALQDTRTALNLLVDSLKLAKKINHLYYIHHNYYDIGGCLLLENKIERAIETHKKCIKPLLLLPEQINANIRTYIRSGIYYILLNRSSEAEYELEKAIELAREKEYYWELTRGLINLGNLYLKEDDFSSAEATYKTCLSYIDINNAESFKLCLYNNLGFLYIQLYRLNKDINYFKTSVQYIIQVMKILKPSFSRSPFDQHNIYEALSITNLFHYQKILNGELRDKLALESSINDFNLEFKRYSNYDFLSKKPVYIENFKKKLSDELNFYIIYMSFS